MLPKKPRHILYAIPMVIISLVFSSAHTIALFPDTMPEGGSGSTRDMALTAHDTYDNYSYGIDYTEAALAGGPFAATMYATIIQGADQQVSCPNDGSTVAKFFLCGTSDVRTVRLSQNGSTYQWQKLNTNRCAQSVMEDCANTVNNCYDTVGSASTYDLNSAGEFRVRVDGGQYYYFKASLNPLNPQLIKEDIVCGNPGRVEVTNVPSGYEYSLNNVGGPYQDSPYFDITTSGNYKVWVRLKNVSSSSCVFPSNTVTVDDLDMNVAVTSHDILCSGELGSIDVQISGVPGFYTYRLIKNGVTVDTFGPNGSSSYTFDNVSQGTYSVRVETNRCNELITVDTNNEPITIGGGISPLAVSTSTSDSFGCGATTVDVTVTTSGGTAPYRISLDGGNSFGATYNSSTTFKVTSAGTYNVVVEDANGCRRSANADVEDLPPPVYTVSSRDLSCGGANDGRITFSVSEGYGYNLDFSIDNGASYQSSNVFNNLSPGNYQVLIRYQQDAFSCTTTMSTESIGSPAAISGSATADSSPRCGDENGGQISISGVSGGTPPYQYSIGAGFSGTTVFTNLGSGTYTPRIRDANGCVETLPTITFAPLDKPTNMSFDISGIDCISNTANVTVTETGGQAPYTYEIISPSGSAVNNGNNNVFTGLGLGTYTFRVSDAEGCSYDEAFAITDISSISVQAQTTKVVSCVGNSDGEGRFLVDGFDGTYSYRIDSGPVTSGHSAGTIDLNGLSAGSYTITVTDEQTNCTDTATLEIQEPPTALAISGLDITEMNCQNANVGSVSVNTVGGWGGNRYTLIQPNGSVRGPKNGRTFSNLTQDGLYQVSVTDANGCSVTDSFTLTSLDAPQLVVDASTDYCFDNTDAASIAVNASGGQAPYQYRINNGAWGGSSSFSGLAPGTYTVDVTDVNDCRDAVTVIIASGISATATTVRELTCGGPAAQIRVNISNGYPSGGNYDSYEVSIDGGPFSNDSNPVSGNSFTYDIPNDGSVTVNTNYQFQVRDSRGCIAVTNVITISPPESIAGTAVATDTSCGEDNGMIELVPDTSQGIPPYEYSSDGGVSYGNQNIFAGYAPGTYNTFMIRDSRGCVSPLLSATVSGSLPIDATVTANDALCSAGTVEGSIDVSNVSNGTSDYTFTLLDIDGNQVAVQGPTSTPSSSFTNVPPGTYTVITTDASGCEDRDVVTISQNQIDLIPVNTSTPNDCTTAFTYIVDIVGGTAPYQIGLVGSTLTAPNVDFDTHDFTGQISYGVTYFVEVIDDLGCRYIEQIDPIAGPSPINISASATTASCSPGGNGQINYQVSGISPPADFTVRLQDTDTGAIVVGPQAFTNESMPFNGSFTALPPGNYQLLVEDTNSSCDAGALVSITQDLPALVVDLNEPATCNVGAQVRVRANGGSPAYEFAFVAAGAAAPLSYSSQASYEIAGPYPADYDFYVRDANGCINFTTVTVTEQAGVPDPLVNVVNQCSAQNDYTVNVTAPLSTGSGLPEETFQYDIGGGFQDSPNFIVSNPGDYTIVVRDGNGCTNTVLARVFDFFSITANATSEPTCNAGDGVITVNTSGGSGNFRFELNDGVNPVIVQDNNNIFNNISPGNYSILVTDLDSNTSPLCTDTATVEVTVVTNPVISAVPVRDIGCFGAGDGSVTVELQPGSDTDGPFSYILYEGSTTTVVAGPQGAALFDGLSAGTYQVAVISDRGCTDRSGDVVVEEPAALAIATTHTEFTCDPNSNRFSTATITVYTDTNGDGSGTPTGTPPYTYSLSDGTTTYSNGTNNVFEVVDNGSDQTFTITARDQNGCEIETTVSINAPSGQSFTYAVNPISCAADGSSVDPGSIEIIMNQGPGDYEVEILPLGSEPVRSSNGTDRVIWPISTPGDYIFAVTDVGNGGCTYLTPVINVPEYNTIEALIAEVKPVSCFGGNDGEISLQISNYIGRYNYEVFSRDNKGAETSTGVSGSFDTENPVSNPEIITGLPAGNLVVRIEALNTPFCDVVSNAATVREPDRALSVALQQTAEVTCREPGIGEIFARGDGGWGDYQYQLLAPDATVLQDFPDTNVNFSGLSAGVYTVNIKDSEGCIASNTIELSLPDPIVADIRITSPLQCNNDNDAALEAFDVSGGQGPGNYLYQLNRLDEGINSGLQTTPGFANLSSGNYSITVFDGWGCSFTTLPITVSDPEVIVAELVELQPPGCGDVGIMLLTVTNPEPGVSYFYRRAGTTDPFLPLDALDPLAVSVEIEEDITLDPGPFQYDVQNSNGCPFEKSNQISLDPAAPLVISLDLTNATINCAGEATGIIRSEAFGGIGNYVYTLLNSTTPSIPTATNTVRPAQNSGIFRELGPGTYWVYAESGGCTALSTPITISDPPPLVLESLVSVPVSCNGDVDGQIVIETSGGSGMIRYSIADNLSEFFEADDPEFPNRKTFKNLSPRNYEIIIQDDLGCTIQRTVLIEEPQQMVAGIAESTPETCMGQEDGSVRLGISGGTAPYEFAFNSASEVDFRPNPDMYFDNLKGGETYVIFVRDAMGCETSLLVPVGIGEDLNPEAIVEYGCEGIFPGSTATVVMQDASQYPQLLFALDPEDPTDAVTSDAGSVRTWADLPAGEHTVYIYHENGCATYVEFTTESYEPLLLEAIKTGPNEITAYASGGFGGYEYFFQGESFGEENVYYSNEDANISIKVRDKRGCEAVVVVPFDFTGMLDIPNYFSPDGDNLNDVWSPGNRELFPNIEVRIYDRYGRVVAILDQIKSWDGTYNGSEVPSGDYWYVVNANDKEKQQYVGHFTLYR